MLVDCKYWCTLNLGQNETSQHPMTELDDLLRHALPHFNMNTALIFLRIFIKMMNGSCPYISTVRVTPTNLHA